jgi:hypothetical protein
MKPRKFILSLENPHVERVRQRALDLLTDMELEKGKPIEIEVHDFSPKRTLDQNAFYFSAMVAPLADHLGYTKAEMHEVLLGECFGTKTVGGLTVPKKRSSTLKVGEMVEYLDWVPRFAAEMGVQIGVAEGV